MIKVSITFYSPQEKLPEKSECYLVLTKGNHLNVLSYSKKHKKFNAHDEGDPEYALEVKYWAEIPKKLKL